MMWSDYSPSVGVTRFPWIVHLSVVGCNPVVETLSVKLLWATLTSREQYWDGGDGVDVDGGDDVDVDGGNDEGGRCADVLFFLALLERPLV